MKKKIKLHTGAYVEVNESAVVMTQEEWLAEGKKRFGENFMCWNFRCPMCGHGHPFENSWRLGRKIPTVHTRNALADIPEKDPLSKGTAQDVTGLPMDFSVSQTARGSS